MVLNWNIKKVVNSMEWCVKCGSQKCPDDYDLRLCDDCLEELAEEKGIYL